MKFRLIALAACGALTTSALTLPLLGIARPSLVVRTDDEGMHPPQVVRTDDEGMHPPQAPLHRQA